MGRWAMERACCANTEMHRRREPDVGGDVLETMVTHRMAKMDERRWMVDGEEGGGVRAGCDVVITCGRDAGLAQSLSGASPLGPMIGFIAKPLTCNRE